MFKLHDFYCKICDLEWEDLTDDGLSVCPFCDTETTRLVQCTGKLAAFSLLSQDGKRQEMLRRSAEHTAKELKKEPERFGAEGVKRARMGQVRSVGGLGK